MIDKHVSENDLTSIDVFI